MRCWQLACWGLSHRIQYFSSGWPLVPTSPGIRSEIEQRRLCRHSNQHFESRKGSAFSNPHLAGGGNHNLGYHAFVWETILHGDAGEFGKYTILKYLPDKIAWFLYEHHDSDYFIIGLAATWTGQERYQRAMSCMASSNRIRWTTYLNM